MIVAEMRAAQRFALAIRPRSPDAFIASTVASLERRGLVERVGARVIITTAGLELYQTDLAFRAEVERHATIERELDESRARSIARCARHRARRSA